MFISPSARVRTPTRSAVNLLICCTATLCCCAAMMCRPFATDAAPIYPVPTPDPFFSAPTDLGSLGTGAVVRTRRVVVPFAPGADAWQLIFRSTDAEGHPIAAATTVIRPPAALANGPLLSYQPVINALGLQCSPSRALLNVAPSTLLPESPGLELALVRGWTVAVPDNEGPTMAYGAARLSGRITLDGLRAVRSVPSLQVAHSPIALAGYSGGAMATAWAAALAPAYAPELPIVGVAMGGTPVNLADMAFGLGDRPHPGFGLAFAAALGLEREYPNRLPISEQLNRSGMAMRDQIANDCTQDIVRIGANHSASQVANSTSLLNSPAAQAVLDANSVQLYPEVPTAPLFVWHSTIDPLVPIGPVQQMLGRYCRGGDKVLFRSVVAADHAVAGLLGAPEAYHYLDARFQGLPAPSNC